MDERRQGDVHAREVTRRAARTLAAACVVAFAAAPAAAASARPPLLTVGRLTLRELSAGRIVLRAPPARVVTRPLRFRLPPHARQGGALWYVMRLHFVLTLSPRSGAGLVDVSGATDGRATDLDEVQVSRRAGRLRLAWNQVGLVNGRRAGVRNGTRLELVDENVMVDAGVRPGGNYLQFQLEQYGGVRVARLAILGDSGIEATRLGPGSLRLDVSGEPGPFLRVGETLTLRVRLSNAHARPVRRVTLALAFDRTAFRLVGGRAVQTIAAVTRRAFIRSFRLRAAKPGRRRIVVSADAVNDSPSAVVHTVVRAPPAFNWGLWTAVALFAAGAALVAAGRRPSRRG